MNNEEYLREIVREAVEDVLYEFKSDIAQSNEERLLNDRDTHDHSNRKALQDPLERRWRRSINDHRDEYRPKARSAAEKRERDEYNKDDLDTYRLFNRVLDKQSKRNERRYKRFR